MLLRTSSCWCASRGRGAPRPLNPSAGPIERRVAVIAALVLVAGLMSAGALQVIRPAGSARSVFLGKVDIARQCRLLGYAEASLDGTTAYDWHCVGPDRRKEGLSVIDACRRQYRQTTAVARSIGTAGDRHESAGRSEDATIRRPAGHLGPAGGIDRISSDPHVELPLGGIDGAAHTFTVAQRELH
jgi:hypothetical protein